METEKPSAPSNLLNENNVLSWERAEDNMGISHYVIYRNNKAVAFIEETAEHEYMFEKDGEYSIEAVDAAGNVSERGYF